MHCRVSSIKSNVMAEFDFEKAWKKVGALEKQDRPRSLSKAVSRIEREGMAAKRWPDAARAFICRIKAESFVDWVDIFSPGDFPPECCPTLYDFVIETSYRIAQRGEFAGGIATLQCMYAPQFTVHSDAQPVSVVSSR